MDPINYTIDVQSPFASALQGYQAGVAIREDRLKAQQQQAALQQQMQMRQDLASLAANPTPQAIVRASLLYPQLSEQFKRTSDMLSAEQQKNQVNAAIPAYAAVLNGKSDVAASTLRETATALQNSGQQQEAAQTRAVADLIEQHPEFAKMTMGLRLSSLMGPDKFAETFGKLGQEVRSAEKAPAELAKANADASTAQSDAVIKKAQALHADESVLLDLQKKGWDIKALQSDIDYKKRANDIAAMNASTARQGSDLKRQELQLQIDQKKQALDQHVRDTVAGAESSAANIDNSLNTIERIKKNPALNSVLGSIQGRMPALLDDQASDAIALIETLGSQAFLSQIPAMKGQGALSNAEGEKLQAALTNLSRVQSETQFRANLDEAARLMKKARSNISKKTGVPLAAPDTPAAPGSRPPLSSFQK